jgi:tryptophanyl-tRNA synthetase
MRGCEKFKFALACRFLGNSANRYTPCKCTPISPFFAVQTQSKTQLGNYLGALSNWVKLQKTAAPEDELLFAIVGWHALTLPQDPKTLSDSRMDMLAILLAIGIDPKRSIVFHQDQVGFRYVLCDS